jgi:hypothetical protein
MKSVARRLATRSYLVSKQVALARMRRSDPTVVVFSMGKTGSTAIARAVHDATGDRVFQVFRLVADRLAEAEVRYRAGARPPFPGALHLWESEFLLRRPPTPSAPWTVITTVREPIAQAVSAFFHGGGRRGVLGGATPDAVAETLLAESWVRPPLRWFDREFAPALGIDVFDHPFDPAAGYRVIATPSVRVLLLRQESLAIAAEVLADFLGRTEPVPVPARNEAAGKEYATQYREFLASVRLPGPVLDQAYSSRYARHFYADSELERFRQRWSRGPAAAASSG